MFLKSRYFSLKSMYTLSFHKLRAPEEYRRISQVFFLDVSRVVFDALFDVLMHDVICLRIFGPFGFRKQNLMDFSHSGSYVFALHLFLYLILPVFPHFF